MYTPEQRKAIKDMVVEVSASMTRMEGEKSLIKEAIAKVSTDHSIEKKILSRVARTFHAQSYVTATGDFDEFQTVYEEVFEPEKSI